MKLKLLAALGAAAMAFAGSVAQGAGIVEFGLKAESPTLGRPIPYAVYKPFPAPAEGERWPVVYLLHGMTGADGGFYSAEDADSIPPDQAGQPDAHKVEGAFYVWSASELRDILGDDASVFAERFGIEEGGNAPADPQGEFVGRNLLYTASSVEDVAARTGRSRCRCARPSRCACRSAVP